MNYGKQAFFLLLLLAAVFSGCKSTKSAPDPGAAEAMTAANNVLTQFKAGEFSRIYKESAAEFQKSGPEAKFVTQFQETVKRSGAFTSQKEAKCDVGPNNTYLVTFAMETDHFNSTLHMIFKRSAAGKMELSSLHEHNEARK